MSMYKRLLLGFVIMTLGGTACLIGAVQTQWSPTRLGPPSARERVAANGFGFNNFLEGSIAINGAVAPKGVVAAFVEEDLFHAVAFGDIRPNGNYTIKNLPSCQVILTLRKDLEQTPKGGPIPKNIADFERMPKVGEHAPHRFIHAQMEPAANQEQPGFKDSDFLIHRAYQKYGDPKSESAIRTVIAEGANRLDINLLIP